MNEDRKRFFLIASLLDPRTKSLRVTVFLQWNLKVFTVKYMILKVDVLHQDASVHQPFLLSDLLRGSTSMDVDVDSVRPT